MSAQLTIGSRAQVWHGTAHHTSGGLTKDKLMMHNGRIVSKAKHALGKKIYARNKHMMATPYGKKSAKRRSTRRRSSRK